jgi:hypothetical protein
LPARTVSVHGLGDLGQSVTGLDSVRLLSGNRACPSAPRPRYLWVCAENPTTPRPWPARLHPLYRVSAHLLTLWDSPDCSFHERDHLEPHRNSTTSRPTQQGRRQLDHSTKLGELWYTGHWHTRSVSFLTSENRLTQGGIWMQFHRTTCAGPSNKDVPGQPKHCATAQWRFAGDTRLLWARVPAQSRGRGAPDQCVPFPRRWTELEQCYAHCQRLLERPLLPWRCRVPDRDVAAVWLDRHRRSTDGGNTWTHPRDEQSGLLFRGGAYHTPPNYHCAPVPVCVVEGRIYRAFEDNTPCDWPSGFQACVISADANADLLDASSWRISNKLAFDLNWAPAEWGAVAKAGWLEGNVVPGPDGGMWNVLRVNARSTEQVGWPVWNKAALVRIEDAGQR